MAVELVTGYAGKAHVSSSEDGARQAGTVGTGMYALETVDEPLKATLENANTVTVGPGDVLINGRHVQLTGSTTFAVPVGTQGMQTSNLLVLRYELAEDETESVTAITLTGEPAASDPQDPTLATGSVLDGDSPVDMPLYRVVTTGIESAHPVKLFETMPPIAGLGFADLAGSVDVDQLPVVPVSKGGTGATSAAAARTALGLGALATLGSPLPVANGGTGATTAVAAAKTLAFVRLAGQYADARLEQQADAQQGIKLIADGAMRRMLVGADSYMGMWNIDTSSWLWQLWPGKLLWSGSWSSGQVTISGINRYKILAVTVSNSDDRLVGVNTGSGTVSLFANACWDSDSASTMAVSAIRLTRSGSSETLTYGAGGRINLGNDYSYGKGVINAVYGVA